MKTKLVLWGNNAQDERVLIAMQLRAADNKVEIRTFPEAIASPEFAQKMLNEWRNGAADIEFPEGGTHIEKELTVAESILPNDLKVERPDLVQRAQSEWHFIVLSTKLHESYKSELAEIQDKIGQMADYSSEVWDSLKNFWDKVQEQVRDRNLFREHADVLRDNTNSLFDQLKKMRTSMTNEFDENSKALFAQFNSILDVIEKKVEQGVQRFPDIFEDLKKTQTQFRDKKLKREHSNDIWNRIDNLFKVVKEKKFGSNAINDGSAGERLARRYEGLIGAMDKMQDSIDRDKDELEFQTKRVNNSTGQLEAQIRQAKIEMIVERVKSKQEKLDEMLSTKSEVEFKMKNFKEKEARKAIETAKAEQKNVSQDNIQQEAESKITSQVEASPISEVSPMSTDVESQNTEGGKESVSSAVETEHSQVEIKSNTKSEAPAEAFQPSNNDMRDIAANAHAAVEAVEKIKE